MRRVLTIAQMREGDRYTIERLGIPEEDLILRAGEALAGAIRKRFRGGRVLFVCGRGNNGKDGARRGAVARPVARLSAGRLLGGTVF